MSTIAPQSNVIRANVLIVEDEIAIADTLIYALNMQGFSVRYAASLVAARNEIAKQCPDLLILDIGLPDGEGFDLCRELRANTATKTLPIVMLTARSEEVDRIVGLELGADDYVAKPFSPREVCLRVKAILRRTPHAPLSNAGIEIDAVGQRATYKGAALDLTRLELHLLQVLNEQPGRVYSRERLLDRVWGRDAESMERTVDTHIKTLRAKLRDVEPARELIVTHRGLGYALVAGS
jgi:two-component system, OmpR family, catabolic regulation response regulator CreB